jgi:hypothetical protein
MKDIKTAHHLAGDEFWPVIPQVAVPGDTGSAPFPKDASQAEGEATVQSWRRVAVLEVSSRGEVYWGFIAGEHMQFMNVPVQLRNGRFAVRIGDGPVAFFIIPVDLSSRPKLTLIEITSSEDPAYKKLPLYYPLGHNNTHSFD